LSNSDLSFGYVPQIINAINEKKVIVPNHFQNNIAWVKTGAITKQAFLDSYYYLANQGMIHVAQNWDITPTPSKTGLGAWFFSTPTEPSSMKSDSTPFDPVPQLIINKPQVKPAVNNNNALLLIGSLFLFG